MPNWKKVIVSGSAAEITELKATGLSAIGASERTTLMISATGVVGTSELGSNAFNSNTYNNYSLPAGSSSTRGGFKIGYSESGKNYPVEVSAEKMYVNVPWTDTNTDTNTTYSAGGGLTLSGTTFSHTDTSARSSINGSGRTYIQDITLDTYGHVTGLATATETVVNTNTQLSDAQVRSKFTGGTNVAINSSGVISSTNTNTTYSAGGGLTLSGTTFSHTDTSARSSVNGSGRTYIQDITLDGYGHITGLATATETVVNTDTNTQLSDAQVRGKFSAGTNVSITAAGVISSTDTNTNTTYSVGDGGLTQKNFTTALKAKLDAIPTLTSNTDVDTGIETVMSVDDASIGIFFDYVVSNGTNLRAGTVTSVHDGTNVEYAETSTADLGDTNDLTLSVDISAGNVRLRATAKSNNWSVKVLARLI